MATQNNCRSNPDRVADFGPSNMRKVRSPGLPIGKMVGNSPSSVSSLGVCFPLIVYIQSLPHSSALPCP